MDDRKYRDVAEVLRGLCAGPAKEHETALNDNRYRQVSELFRKFYEAPTEENKQALYDYISTELGDVEWLKNADVKRIRFSRSMSWNVADGWITSAGFTVQFDETHEYMLCLSEARRIFDRHTVDWTLMRARQALQPALEEDQYE